MTESPTRCPRCRRDVPASDLVVSVESTLRGDGGGGRVWEPPVYSWPEGLYNGRPILHSGGYWRDAGGGLTQVFVSQQADGTSVEEHAARNEAWRAGGPGCRRCRGFRTASVDRVREAEAAVGRARKELTRLETEQRLRPLGYDPTVTTEGILFRGVGAAVVSLVAYAIVAGQLCSSDGTGCSDDFALYVAGCVALGLLCFVAMISVPIRKDRRRAAQVRERVQRAAQAVRDAERRRDRAAEPDEVSRRR